MSEHTANKFEPPRDSMKRIWTMIFQNLALISFATFITLFIMLIINGAIFGYALLWLTVLIALKINNGILSELRNNPSYGSFEIIVGYILFTPFTTLGVFLAFIAYFKTFPINWIMESPETLADAIILSLGAALISYVASLTVVPIVNLLRSRRELPDSKNQKFSTD